MAKRLKSLSSRVFHTLAEFEADAEQTTKAALTYTLDYFKDKFIEIAKAHIYNNAYKAKWYDRTNWLEDENAIEVYIYKNVKNAIGGGVVKLSPDFDVQIININVASQFMTHISTSISMAAVIAFPYFIWEIWKFIEPALFEEEIRHLRPAFMGGTFMFYLGCAIGYLFVFPFTFRFLVEYNLSPNITNQINLQSYIDNFTLLILVMGIVFEMPLLAQRALPKYHSYF